MKIELLWTIFPMY